MKDNTALKFFIPLLAVVIIIECVLLIDRMGGSKASQQNESTMAPVVMTWGGETASEMGKISEVSLKMSVLDTVAVDAVDLYIKYDPTKVMISGFETDSDFVKPSFSRISQDKGMVVANFLVTEPKGFEIEKNKEIELAKLKVNYLTAGEVIFELGDATLVVENGTAKVLPFNNDKLVVNVVSN